MNRYLYNIRYAFQFRCITYNSVVCIYHPNECIHPLHCKIECLLMVQCKEPFNIAYLPLIINLIINSADSQLKSIESYFHV